MLEQSPAFRKPDLKTAGATITGILISLFVLCGCETDGISQNVAPGSVKSISVGAISIDYPGDYEVLSEENVSELISVDGSSYTLHRAVVGTEDFVVTYTVEYAEDMTLGEVKSEIERSMDLLVDPDGLDAATRALAEQTVWEPVEEVQIAERDGFVSTSVMYGDTKVITYHVETGSDSVGMVTGAIPLDWYNEDPASFDLIFSSISVL